MTDDESRIHPIEWPAIWWKSESFWREVATRTIAGTMTLVIIGLPVLLYAYFNELLPGEQAWALVIGLSMTAFSILSWYTAYVIYKVEPIDALKKLREQARVARLAKAATKGNDRPDMVAALQQFNEGQANLRKHLWPRVIIVVIFIPIVWIVVAYQVVKICQAILEASN